MTPALVVRDLVVRGAGGFEVGPVDLELPLGGSCAVVGRAGAGKSLLLSGIVGLAPIARGQVVLERARVGFCFQRDALLDDEDALANVRLAVRGRGLDDDEGRARRALAAVGLEDAAHKQVVALSGGMKKRLGVARALATEPLLLVADAPTAGLDPSTAAAVLDRMLERVERAEAAALFATHDVDAILPRVQRVLVLERGRVIFEGAPRALAERGELEPFAARRGAA